MSTPVWPDTLPRCIRPDAPFNEQPVAQRVSFPSDIGPPIERAKSSIRVRSIDVSWLMTPDQVRFLEDFVFDTLGQATSEFLFLHPRTLTMVRARFEGDPPYRSERIMRGKFSVAATLMVIG
ncbi:MAG: hypothetical protein BGN85_08835 [Alphaproteobacteria bacterium 64-11]|nr:MAG: hypothetical protein BGN85_08835 [Alphaproteobacteria bacterium 64-11]